MKILLANTIFNYTNFLSEFMMGSVVVLITLNWLPLQRDNTALLGLLSFQQVTFSRRVVFLCSAKNSIACCVSWLMDEHHLLIIPTTFPDTLFTLLITALFCDYFPFTKLSLQFLTLLKLLCTVPTLADLELQLILQFLLRLLLVVCNEMRATPSNI